MKTLSPIKITVATFAALGLLVACAPPKPPQELVAARADFSRAQNGPAAQFDPADVHEANTALNAAEKAYQDEPSATETLDLAVVASLKAKSAEAKASAIMAQNQKTDAEAQYQELQQQKLAATQGALTQTNAALNKTSAQLQVEAQHRQDAEKQLADARASLIAIAAVKEDARGMILTMPAETLFKTNKADLLPSASAKLDGVAKTLKSVDRDIEVDGFTDSTGTDAINVGLSQRRADAVKDYLVQKGVPDERIHALGFGSKNPVADNGTVEGRAMNRRVEIVVEQEKAP